MNARMRLMRERADESAQLLADAFVDPATKPEVAGLPAAAVVPEQVADVIPVPAAAPIADPAVAGLQAEIARLNARLNDENNPTDRARYSSLQGMFNVMRTEMDALKAAALVPAAAIIPDTTEYDTLVKEQGETTANLLRPYLVKIAEMEATLAGVTGEMKTTKEQTGRVAQVQAQTADEQFFTALETASPGWKKTNGWAAEGVVQDPRFDAFIRSNIPGTLIPYQTAMNEAYGKRNAASVADIFTTFQKSLGVIPAVPAVPAAKTAQEELARLVEADKVGKGAAVPAAGATEIIPHAEYDAFVNSIKRGTFTGTRDERTALQNRFDTALSENRIR